MGRVMSKKNTGKISTVATGTSGAAGIISAHNVCHMACLGVVAFLSLFGIAVSSTALMFLQDYNLLFWNMGLFFLTVSLIIYVKLRCISARVITANGGIIIAGFPFLPSQQLTFWIVGGSIFLIALGGYISSKMRWKHEKKRK